MKAFYETPDVEIVAFENEDIITTSGADDGPPTTPIIPLD